MILYNNEYNDILKYLEDSKGIFSSILLEGDYGKGKTTLINQVVKNLPNKVLFVCKYPGMNTPFEALSSALFQEIENSNYDISGINIEISHREYLKQIFINICKQIPDIIIVFHDMRDFDSTTTGLIKEIIKFLDLYKISCHIIMEYSTDNLSFEQQDELLEYSSLCTLPRIKLNTVDTKIYTTYFLEILSGENMITQEQIDSIISEAFYNPAMIKKLVYYFMDVGIFFQQEGRWYSDEIDFHLTAKLFEKNIYQRYEKLDDALQLTLNKACITGYEINSKLLYQPLGIIKSEDNLRRIERLSRLITRTEDNYQFENNTVYNLVNDKMRSSERKALHLLVANYLFEKIDDYLKDEFSKILRVLYIIKEHYINAEQIEKALHAIGCYVERAYCLRNYDAALSGIKEFLDLSDGKYCFAEQQMILLKSKIYGIYGRYTKAYEQLMTINQKYLPKGIEYWVSYNASYFLFNNGETTKAKKIADKLIEKFDCGEIDDPFLLIKLDILLSGMYHHFGDVRYASRRYEQALAVASRNSAYQREYYYLLSISNMFLDNEMAISSIEKSIQYFEKKHLIISCAKSLNNVAINYIYACEFSKAFSQLEKSYKVFVDICSISCHYPLNNMGTIYGHMQNYVKAEETFRKALENYIEPFSKLWILINIAHCKRKQGELPECEKILNQVENEICELSENTHLLKRNFHIAKGLLQLEAKNYSDSYDSFSTALYIELNLLQNDTYLVFLSKLLLNISEMAEQPFPDIAIPYKDSYVNLFCQNLLENKTHWGNFLFWEM